MVLFPAMIKNLLLFGFVFAGLVVAQPTAPVFTLSSTDAASLAGYTNVDPLNVNVTSYQGSPIGWCIHLSTGFTTYCQNSGNWTHAVPTAFTLPSGSADGPYTVDLVYKTTAVSTIGSASIILDTISHVIFAFRRDRLVPDTQQRQCAVRHGRDFRCEPGDVQSGRVYQRQ